MSCWVVPAVAAEIWGVSVNHVLDGVQRGTIQSKKDLGFLLVDAAPHSPCFQKSGTSGVRPSTFTIAPACKIPEKDEALVTQEEQEALLGVHEVKSIRITENKVEEEDEGLPEYEAGRLSWASARLQASRMRRRPAA